MLDLLWNIAKLLFEIVCIPLVLSFVVERIVTRVLFDAANHLSAQRSATRRFNAYWKRRAALAVTTPASSVRASGRSRR